MERSLLTNDNLLTKREAKDDNDKTSTTLKELRRKIYMKAKADKTHQAKGRLGFGWTLWSTKGLYAMYNIYSDFKVAPRKVTPA